MNKTAREMPRYISHKEVWARKIQAVALDTDGSATITPADLAYSPFKVDADYVRKYKPKVGGYYIFDPDRYKSWSSANACE